MAVSGPEDALRGGEGVAVEIVVARRVHVDELHVEIGVGRVGADMEFDAKRAGDLDIFRERIGLEDQNVCAACQRQFVRATGMLQVSDLVQRTHIVAVLLGKREIVVAADLRARLGRIIGKSRAAVRGV